MGAHQIKLDSRCLSYEQWIGGSCSGDDRETLVRSGTATTCEMVIVSLTCAGFIGGVDDLKVLLPINQMLLLR